MCGGSGSGGLNFMDDVLDVVTQIGTIGTLEFKDSKFKTSGTTRMFKDLIGVTAAEENNKILRQQMEEEKARRSAEREELKAQSAREQLMLSRQAGGNTSGGISLERGKASATGRYSNTLGSDEENLLGI